MIFRFTMALILITICNSTFSEQSVSQQIDHDTWLVISEAVQNADIAAMASTYHPDAVLVSDKETTPIKSALENWGEGMKQAAIDGTRANVSFRFKNRMDHESTAFEIGMFKYTAIDADGKESTIYINFESLLVKKDNRWLYIMERQLDASDQVAWNALEK